MRPNIRNTVGVMSLTAATIMLTACSPQQKETSHKVIVKTTRPTAATDREKEDYSFIAQPWRTSELSFRVSGPVDRLEAYAGNRYRRGSIIAEIDPRDFRIRQERAEATFRQMEAEYNRIALLYDKDNVSASLYEKTKADYVTAKTAYHVAVNELEDTRLIAPFDGYIGEVFIEKYQDIKASQPVVTLIDIDRLKIEIYITQDIVQTIHKTGQLDIVFDTEPGRRYQARIMDVAKSTMSNNLSYLLTAMLPNPDGHLLAGMSGKAQLPLADEGTDEGVVIPLSALCHRPVDGDFVWVVHPQTSTVSKCHVTCGRLLPDGNVTISKGLSLEDLIATTGLRFLSDEMEVIVSNDR